MKIINRLLRRHPKEIRPDTLFRMSNIISLLLDRATFEIFASHREVLLREPPTYIVPAVWGESDRGPLDSVQGEMNRKIGPVVEEAIGSLKKEGQLTPSQEFAIQYLIRGYMITRILFMVESLRALSTSTPGREAPPKVDLSCLQPIGRA